MCPICGRTLFHPHHTITMENNRTIRGSHRPSWKSTIEKKLSPPANPIYIRIYIYLGGRMGGRNFLLKMNLSQYFQDYSRMMNRVKKMKIVTSHANQEISFFIISTHFPFPPIIQFSAFMLRVIVEPAAITFSLPIYTPFRIIVRHPIHT